MWEYSNVEVFKENIEASVRPGGIYAWPGKYADRMYVLVFIHLPFWL